MKKDVVFSPDALTDLEGIKEYISVVLSNALANLWPLCYKKERLNP